MKFSQQRKGAGNSNFNPDKTVIMGYFMSRMGNTSISGIMEKSIDDYTKQKRRYTDKFMCSRWTTRINNT